MSDDLTGKRADVLAEAHAWLDLNSDLDAVEAGGAVTPSTKLVLALKEYASDLRAEVVSLRAKLEGQAMKKIDSGSKEEAIVDESNGNQTLEEFLNSVNAVCRSFRARWLREHAEEPNAWPLEMSEADWWEQLTIHSEDEWMATNISEDR